jgi:D-alanine-D-alanine ligase
VKPLSGGSSLGVVVTNSFEELFAMVRTLLEAHHAVLVEEYIKGRELTCGVIDGLNGTTYPLFPIEIVRDNNDGVWDYEAKYGGGSLEVCPANLDRVRFLEIQRLAVLAHQKVGLRHYSRSDFMVSPRGIYLLEVNSLPGLTKESLLPKALRSANLEFSDFLDFVVTNALAGT